MALSFVGSAEAIAGGSGENLSVTLTHPGGIAADDVVYFALAAGREGGADFDMSMSTAGYTELADLFADASRESHLGVFRKVMPATPDSVATGQYNATGFPRVLMAVEHVWRGADTTTPESVTSTTATGTGGANADSPSITTGHANTEVLSVGASSHNDVPATITQPSGYTNVVDIAAQPAGVGAVVGIASKSVAGASTAENPAAWAIAGGNAGDAWCAATICIRPAAAVAATSLLSSCHSPSMISTLMR